MLPMVKGAHSAEKQSFWRRHKGLRVAALSLAGAIALLAAFLAATNAVVVGVASERIVPSDDAADSKADALGMGIDATGVASDFRTFAQQPAWDAREALARTKDLFAVLTQAPPTFGGDPIDLKQSGSVTDD